MPKTMKSADASANVQTMLASLSKPNNMLPNLSSEKNEEIKNKLMLASFLSRRLVAGASIACSGAEGELNSKTVNLDLIINASANIIMRKDVGGGTTQSMLELCHKDITFLPLFKKCKKCGTCEPIIENNEWQGYDETYKIGEGYGLNKDEAYMICTKGEGYIYPTDDGQRNIMKEHAIYLSTLGALTFSEDYFMFLKAYEAGSGDEWQYAQNLGDGVITVAYGVVLKDANGIYPLTKPTYDYYMGLAASNTPITREQAEKVTRDYLEEEYVKGLNEKARAKGWVLNSNQYDAILDLYWNAGPKALKYKSTEIIAIGDLSNHNVQQQLATEILESAKFTDNNGVMQWAKNLVERRLDTIRIAEGGTDAYSKNEITPKDWNQNGRQILINGGLDPTIVNKYPIQKVKEY